MWDWGIRSRRSLPSRDWLVVLAIVLIAAERGFLEALLFGILAGCVIFAVDVSRIRVIRHQFGLDERASSVIRSTAESALLAEHGAQVQVLELSGYLLFGSAYSVQERVARLVTGSKPREVIFDFSGVTGIDSSAGACFAKIRDVLRQNGARQVMAALSPAAANVMSASSGLDDGVGRHDHLDKALEEAEETLLAARAESCGSRRSLTAWLEEALGSRGFAEELCAHLTPAPRDADSYLCRQGDPTDSLIFVERGPSRSSWKDRGYHRCACGCSDPTPWLARSAFPGRTAFGKPARRSRCRRVGSQPWQIRRFEEDATREPLGAFRLHHPIAVRTPHLCQSPDCRAPALSSGEAEFGASR